jgi:hypothetical protein
VTQSSTPAPSMTTPLSADQVEALAPALGVLGQLADAVRAFLRQSPSPANTAAFEQHLAFLTNQIALNVFSHALGSIEPLDREELPPEVRSHGIRYRLRKTVGWNVACLFGQFRLVHYYYEPRQAPGAACLHPLCDLLGIFAWCTPGLLKKTAHLSAEHSQKATLLILADEHQVYWSEDKLRSVLAWVAGMLSEQRTEALAGRVVQMLEQAQASKGSHLPVLVCGRDGITMPMVQTPYQEGAVATITVYDRKGKRLGTVYLSRAPEAEQKAMTKALTALLEEILRRFPDRRLRLAYVTDAGWWPAWYYREVLRHMADPAHAGKRVEWEWVVDYYHASLYVTKMAQGLFGETAQAQEWAVRMRRLLKETDGVKRVLQSAGYNLSVLKYAPASPEKYREGWNYLHNYGRWMTYERNKRLGVPLGSGVTEAGCKVIVTQRLKRSGMRWEVPGAQVVLDIRSAIKSGVWDLSFQAFNRCFKKNIGNSYDDYIHCLARKAA